MIFNYNNNDYIVKVIKKNNKYLYIRVINNEIIVTCNHFTSMKSIEKVINDNRDTIIKMINASIKKKKKEEKFILFGKSYDIIYGFNDFEIIDDKIYINDKKKLDKWLNNYIYNTFKTHLDYWYDKYEESIPIPNLKIRKMKTRWGVCNIKNKNITLNSELIKYDIECLDYVIIHELSHFIHPNHSKEFWLQVSKYCPNYKYFRKKLKD